MEVLMTNVEEMTKTPSGLFVLWLIFGGIVFDIALRLWGAIKAHNTPSLHERFVERKVFDEFKIEVNGSLEKVNEELKEQSRLSGESRRRIYDEIKQLGRDLHTRIDALPERIKNLINN